MTASHISLREVAESDLPHFYEYQLDPDAAHMAAFMPADHTDRDAFMARWRQMLADDAVAKRTIMHEGAVAGHVVAFTRAGVREISYWIDRARWGRGLATDALRAFLDELPDRPVHARAAADNAASLRVLEKCGFRATGSDRAHANARGAQTDELILTLG